MSLGFIVISRSASYITARWPKLALLLALIFILIGIEITYAVMGASRSYGWGDYLLIFAFGLALLSFIVALYIIYRASFNTSSKEKLIFLLLAILVVKVQLGVHEVIHRIETEKIEGPSLDPKHSALSAGEAWALEEGSADCEVQSKSYAPYAAEFVQGCAKVLQQVGPQANIAEPIKIEPEPVPSQTSIEDIANSLQPHLPSGVSIVHVMPKDAGFVVRLVCNDRTGAINPILDNIANSGIFKKPDFYSATSISVQEFEADFYVVESKPGSAKASAALPSKTPIKEIEHKVQAFLPKGAKLVFVIPSGSGFMLDVILDPSTPASQLVSGLQSSGAFGNAVMKSAQEVTADAQEVLVLVTERPIR